MKMGRKRKNEKEEKRVWDTRMEEDRAQIFHDLNVRAHVSLHPSLIAIIA